MHRPGGSGRCAAPDGSDRQLPISHRHLESDKGQRKARRGGAARHVLLPSSAGRPASRLAGWKAGSCASPAAGGSCLRRPAEHPGHRRRGCLRRSRGHTAESAVCGSAAGMKGENMVGAYILIATKHAWVHPLRTSGTNAVQRAHDFQDGADRAVRQSSTPV